jgi:broad specificity phosphatase PhoE
MVTIIFEPHSTTTDNEAHQSSGWNDVKLSATGMLQAKELGQRRKLKDFDAIFTSDLDRAISTAKLAFGNIAPNKLFIDWRLRELDYGNMTGHPKDEVDQYKPNKITVPFTGGESYEQSTTRIHDFLADLLRKFDDKTVMVIGHQATQYGLEYWTNGTPLKESITKPWKWQPGWIYKLNKI